MSTTLSAAERKLRASLAAHESWAKTEDRTQRTSSARRAFALSFEDKVDPERKLSASERARRAESARKAHYQRLALKSAKARRLKAESRRAGGERLGDQAA